MKHTKNVGKRSIYFYRFSFENKLNIKDEFKIFVKENVLSIPNHDDGEEYSLSGFLINVLTHQPLIEEFSSHLEVEYGTERKFEVIRLNGEREIYHIPRRTKIILDLTDYIIAIYTSSANVANDLFEKLLNDFAEPRKINLRKIEYVSDFLHWLTNNAVSLSDKIEKMEKVKVEKGDEIGVISHEDDILLASLYKIVDEWKLFEYIEGKISFKNKQDIKQYATFRVYEHGKMTITHDEPYKIAKLLYNELSLLYENHINNNQDVSTV
ncbi:MAG: hypothetical protein AB7V56_06855 [Candidatus Nitrosocosmicus sp.]